MIWWKGLSLSRVFIWISAKRSRIDFVVVPSNLLLYGLDFQDKKNTSPCYGEVDQVR